MTSLTRTLLLTLTMVRLLFTRTSFATAATKARLPACDSSALCAAISTSAPLAKQAVQLITTLRMRSSRSTRHSRPPLLLWPLSAKMPTLAAIGAVLVPAVAVVAAASGAVVVADAVAVAVLVALGSPAMARMDMVRMDTGRRMDRRTALRLDGRRLALVGWVRSDLTALEASPEECLLTCSTG